LYCFCGAFAGKFGAVFASIPTPIIAAISCLLFAYAGMYIEDHHRKIVNRFVIFFSFKNLPYQRGACLSSSPLNYYKCMCCFCAKRYARDWVPSVLQPQ
jgi:hypothetical protein